MTLPPGAWRTLYNVVDALQPREDHESACDLAPAVERQWAAGEDPDALRRTLSWLEFESRLLASPAYGFCWLSRPARQARLESWRRSVLPWRRRGYARLLRVVTAARAAALHSLPGA